MSEPKPPAARRPGPPPWLGKVVLESLLIVFSVLLALNVDQWRQDHDRARQAREAERYFLQEIVRNRQNLEAGLARHRRMAETWRALAGRPHPTVADRNRAWGLYTTGVYFVPFRDAVWNSVSGSEVMQSLPLEEVMALSATYRGQADVDALADSMQAAWRIPHADAEQPAFVKDDIRAMQTFLGDLVGAEERLLIRYRESERLLRATQDDLGRHRAAERR